MNSVLKLSCIVAVASLPILAGTAMAQNAPSLRLYGQTGFAGTSVRLDRGVTDLSSQRFDDAASSMIAEGRWEVCLDASYTGGCRVIQGRVSDMGDWAGKVTSARYLGPSDWGSSSDSGGGSITSTRSDGTSVVTANATPTAAAPPAAAPEQAYVYETDYSGIKPQLTVSAFQNPIDARYEATQSDDELQALYRQGSYGILSGWTEAQFDGDTLSGYWYESGSNAALSVYCDPQRSGTHSYGRFSMRFNADRSAFEGTRSSCDTDFSQTGYAWNGRLSGRTTMAATTPRSGPTGTQPTNATPGQPLPGAVDRTIRAAGDEVERRTQDRIREGIGRLF
jgi:hypothetical protein